MAPASMTAARPSASFDRLLSAPTALSAASDSGPPDSSASSGGMAPAPMMAALPSASFDRSSSAKVAIPTLSAASDPGSPESSATS
eukprot:scaffold134575_cov63-Phaeocystis_antarctica.AAC.3